MTVCKSCKGEAEIICRYDGHPMLDFCTEDYIEHLEGAHPQDHSAQDEAKALRQELKHSEGELCRLLSDEPGKQSLEGE